MTEPALKPCPFCGGDANHWVQHTDFADRHFISCNKCTAKVWGSTMEGAFGYWNRRVEE